MIEKPINVFVYGTLLFPEITKRLGVVSRDASTVLRKPAVLRGYKRLTVGFRGEADPPAIFKAADSFVAGEILLDITAESLQRLDWFEDIDHGLYTRESVTVGFESASESPTKPHTQTVLTYVCGDKIRKLLRGDWDPQVFRAKYLEWYLANVLPEDSLPR